MIHDCSNSDCFISRVCLRGCSCSLPEAMLQQAHVQTPSNVSQHRVPTRAARHTDTATVPMWHWHCPTAVQQDKRVIGAALGGSVPAVKCVTKLSVVLTLLYHFPDASRTTYIGVDCTRIYTWVCILYSALGLRWICSQPPGALGSVGVYTPRLTRPRPWLPLKHYVRLRAPSDSFLQRPSYSCTIGGGCVCY